MTVNAEQVALDKVPAMKHPARFDFIDQARQSGTVFALEGGGHFIVAPEDSLIPRFVMELSIPRLGDVDYYRAITHVLNDNSCGFMWFDDSDVAAFDLSWRMRLPIIAISALFSVTVNGEPPHRPGLELRTGAESAETDVLSMILTTLPPKQGGLHPSVANRLLQTGDVTVLAHEKSPVGVLVSSPVSTGDVYVHAFAIAPEFQGVGFGPWFMSSFAAKIPSGKSAIFGLPNNSHAEFHVAMSLGAKIINRGWRAQLGSI